MNGFWIAGFISKDNGAGKKIFFKNALTGFDQA
jgi:hypothetical protein